MLGAVGYEKHSTLALPITRATYQRDFPVSQELIYLNHAAVSPLCRPAAEAMLRLTEDVSRYGSLHYDEWMDAYAGLRTAAARLINASPEEIAIVKNTSEGIATVALGMEWNPGDRVIGFLEEFPANYYPWMRLAKQGVQVEWFSIYDPIERIAQALPGVKLLAISYVNYLSGHRVNLEQLGALCREHGCFFFVDAIQGLGAFPLDVEKCRIDALAADGHKWLLGPEGNGILYVRKSRMDSIEPAEFGWTNPAGYADYSSRDMTLRPDAGRYECGTLNTVGCFGLRAAIEYLLEVGIDEVSASVDCLAARIEASVRAKGYELLRERTGESGSGIVSFRHPSRDARLILSELKQNRVLAATRQGWLRMAPHFYVAPEQIDRVLDMLPPV